MWEIRRNVSAYRLAPLWVRAYVPETDLGKLALGMPAVITTDSFPGRRYRGSVGYGDYAAAPSCGETNATGE